MLTLILLIVGIFAGFYALVLIGAIAFGWLVQPLVDGYVLDKKYPQAVGLKLLVYALIGAAASLTLLEIANTITCLIEGRTWEQCCGLDSA